jgi:hypothetical protein
MQGEDDGGEKRILIAATIAVVAVMVFGGSAFAGTILRATLTGAAEVPGPGDPTAAGGPGSISCPSKSRSVTGSPYPI